MPRKATLRGVDITVFENMSNSMQQVPTMKSHSSVAKTFDG